MIHFGLSPTLGHLPEEDEHGAASLYSYTGGAMHSLFVDVFGRWFCMALSRADVHSGSPKHRLLFSM